MRSTTLRGILLRILATLSTIAMLACVRGLEGAIPTGEVVLFRSVGALLPLVIWYGLRGQIRAMMRTQNLAGHFGRGLSGTGGMFFNYLALAFIPLAQATAFSYAAPLFTVVFAAILLREVVRIYRWSAVCVGLLGVLVMLVPALMAASGGSDRAFLYGASAALAGAACAALSSIQIRHMTAHETPGAIVFWFAVMTTLIGAVCCLFAWQTPTFGQLALLMGCGLFGGLNQLLITLALRDAHASVLAPFEYLTMIWSVIVGYLAFGTRPDTYTILGAVIVTGAGLFAIWREARLRRASAAQA